MNLKNTTLAGPVGLTAAIVLVYLVSVLLPVPLQIPFGLLALAVTANIWLALRVLQEPYSTDKTFDEYFYMDREDLRRNRVAGGA